VLYEVQEADMEFCDTIVA